MTSEEHLEEKRNGAGKLEDSQKTTWTQTEVGRPVLKPRRMLLTTPLTRLEICEI